MPDLLLELPDGDITPLLEVIDDAVFVNISPGVEAADVPPRRAITHLVGNSGPTVPFATWTPGEIGVQHMMGPRVTRWLAERGLEVPKEWRVVDEHPKRGLVIRTYQSPPEETLRWLVEAVRRLNLMDVVHPWQAVVRSR